MGEAKTKELLRVRHAEKIVGAIEQFVDANIQYAFARRTATHAEIVLANQTLDYAREELIQKLVTPPPKP